MQLSNPNTPRLATRVDNDSELAQLLTFVHLLLPGAIKFYYGDEIGMVDLNATALKNGEQPQHGGMQWDNTANSGFSALMNATSSVNDDDTNFDVRLKPVLREELFIRLTHNLSGSIRTNAVRIEDVSKVGNAA